MSHSSTLPSEDKDRVEKDSKTLETRLVNLDNDATEEGQRCVMYLGLAECDKAYGEWQTQADDVDKLLETRETELKSVKIPSGDVEGRERQKQILDVRKLCVCACVLKMECRSDALRACVIVFIREVYKK